MMKIVGFIIDTYIHIFIIFDHFGGYTINFVRLQYTQII